MNIDNINNSQEYKYILIDRSDPSLMWNCALSIIVFVFLLYFIFINWTPKCNKTEFLDNLPRMFDTESLRII
jgi:hypothetical protein